MREAGVEEGKAGACHQLGILVRTGEEEQVEDETRGFRQRDEGIYLMSGTGSDCIPRRRRRGLLLTILRLSSTLSLCLSLTPHSLPPSLSLRFLFLLLFPPLLSPSPIPCP
ncbi:hypothetical protein ABZX51_006392 [Aspergillus tubingensis]